MPANLQRFTSSYGSKGVLPHVIAERKHLGR